MRARRLPSPLAEAYAAETLVTTAETLPLPLAQLPESIRRFCDPSGPAPARLMAARGLVPVHGADQVTLLAQLGADPVDDVRHTALVTLKGLPEAVVWPACQAALHPAVLDLLGRELTAEDALIRIVANSAASDATVERIARHGSEPVTERIAVNEQRLLRCPTIIEALYKNRNTRMSTADRLIELAARHGLQLDGIPAYQAHVEAIRNELIVEPSAEALPQDRVFAESLAVDSDESAFEDDDAEQTGEKIKTQFKPLSMAILDMKKSEKLRLAMIGNMAARALLVRDRDKQIAMAAVSSPQTTVAEAAEIAKSKQVSEEILRYVGSKKEFVKSAEVKHNLCFNAKCPVGVSLKFMGHLRADELRRLANSRNVPAQVRSLAAQWLNRKKG